MAAAQEVPGSGVQGWTAGKAALGPPETELCRMLCGYQTAFTLMGLGSFRRRGPGRSTDHPEEDPDLPLIFSDPHPRMLESQRSSCTLASDGENLPI